MAETVLNTTTAPGKWSTTGIALTLATLDNTNGNKFTSANDALLIVQNPTGGSLTMTVTSQPITGSQAGSGRSGNISQSLAAGEIRIFRLTKNGWESGGFVLIPSGLSASLKAGIVILTA